MRKALSKIDKIILLCKNVDKTSSVYCETLGLRVFIQSQYFVELRDANNTPIYLQQSRNPSQLSKGYSPILSFNVTNGLDRFKISKRSTENYLDMTSFQMVTSSLQRKAKSLLF
jgi:hypothetical protein